MRAPHRGARRARAGFTLAEVLVAAIVLVLLVTMALAFLGGQTRALAAAAGRADATQNARFAQSALDRELRMAGANTVATQPALVMAGPYAVTFNADLATRDDEDVYATYYTPAASVGATRALQPPGIVAPLTTFQYPTVPVLDGDGNPARAETISFWARRDSTSTVPDQWVLFRRVNAEPPAVVATGLYLAPGTPLFRYHWIRDSTAAMDTVPAARLPLVHATPTHGAAADTGETRRIASPIDRIRSVTITLAGQWRDPHGGALPVRRGVTSRTALVNLGMLNRVGSCGQAPDPVPVTAALAFAPATGLPDHVALLWPRASDDGAGEKDVERYLVYRRINGAPWGDPLDQVPTTATGGYAWSDFDVRRQGNADAPGATSNDFEYAVVVQDCQPSVSTRAQTPVIAIPLVP